jgi:hypothetical protein
VQIRCDLVGRAHAAVASETGLWWRIAAVTFGAWDHRHARFRCQNETLASQDRRRGSRSPSGANKSGLISYRKTDLLLTFDHRVVSMAGAGFLSIEFHCSGTGKG